jgi:YggT family protein
MEFTMSLAIQLITVIAQLITLLVIVQVALSYFMSPFHPVRQAIDNLVEPLLAPIRRLLPQTGMLDFSPLILIILVQIVARLLTGLLTSLK